MHATESFRIEGISGKKELRGTIAVSGSKNEALSLLAAAALFNGKVPFSNVPVISDIEKMTALLRHAGAVTDEKGSAITVDAATISNGRFDRETARAFRASIILTGPLLARLGKVTFPPPGGCLIGKRPIDVFLSGYERMGARVCTTDDNESFEIVAPEGGLRGAEIFFRVQSVTGTEALLMAASLAHGTSVLHNVAMEPEVTSLVRFLESAGVEIHGIGTPILTVVGNGGKALSFRGEKPWTITPDRIETGSFVILGALCAEELTITNCDPSQLALPLDILKTCGVPIETTPDSIRIRDNSKPNKSFSALTIRTHEYPGFPTDLQAPFGIFATQATGESVVEEMIFEGRLGYLEDIARMGANVALAHVHKAIIQGPSSLSGRELYSPDLRAGLAYIIAACVARGTSHIHNIHYIDRGYERLEEKLRGIGVAIQRVKA